MKHDKVGQRKYISLLIYSDEYDKFGINEKMDILEAKGILRHELGLPQKHPRSQGVKTELRALIKDSNPEKLKKALEVLK